jgi:intracellular sulfur oxidation DsrE/DsrF family protein
MNHAQQNKHPDTSISVEEINAFIDDELIHEDRQRIREQVKKNPELTQLICDIDQVQDWIKEAYEAVPEPRRPKTKWRVHALLPGALAAMALLTVGALAGWFAGKMSATDTGGAQATTMFQANNQSQNVEYASAPTAMTRNVILRLGSDSPQKFRKTLNMVEHLMKTSAHQPGFQLEVLANSDGLDFLRADTSPYAKQIEALMKKYPNLHFMVCGTSLRHIEQSGQKANLLPNVSVTSSAVEQVAQRIREGWSYSAI